MTRVCRFVPNEDRTYTAVRRGADVQPEIHPTLVPLPPDVGRVTAKPRHPAQNGAKVVRRRVTPLLTMVAAIAVTTVGTAPTSVANHGDSARGTIKIEDNQFGDGDNPNEVKVGCDFSVEFFGMEEGSVPVTFTLVPPSGDRVIEELTAEVEEAQGNELSGILEVDLTDELADVAPAQAEDFDFKVRVDAEVKSTKGNDSITKSAILFVICTPEDLGPPVGGVSAGYGGTAQGPSPWSPVSMSALGALVLGGLAVAARRLRRPGA